MALQTFLYPIPEGELVQPDLSLDCGRQLEVDMCNMISVCICIRNCNI